jgi:hypothetical protein
MDNQKKKKNWLGTYKSCIFVPPTPRSELQKLMQAKETEMRPGGRENWAINSWPNSGEYFSKVRPV